jgi:hypothetical protein
MHATDRLYLITAWSYILAFHITFFGLTSESAGELDRLWQDPEP